MQNEDDLRGICQSHGLYAGHHFFIFGDTYLLVLLRLAPRNGLNIQYSG